MSLQGPILIVANKPTSELAQAFTDAGAFPIVEASWAGAPTAAAEIKPSAIVLSEPDDVRPGCGGRTRPPRRRCRASRPYVHPSARGHACRTAGAMTILDDAPAQHLIARVASALRLRTLHSTVLGRAKSLKDERDIVAELPAGGPLDDATVLLIGRGRHHPTLSVAVGERMGVIGALSIDHGVACLKAREIDGIIIGDGLAKGSIDAFLTLLSEDTRFRDLPVAVLGAGRDAEKLPNFVRARDPLLLLERAAPFIRMRTMETALKRLLHSIECKGMIDARTGLFNTDAFGQALALSFRMPRNAAPAFARALLVRRSDRPSHQHGRGAARQPPRPRYRLRLPAGRRIHSVRVRRHRSARRPRRRAQACERAEAHHAARRPRPAGREPFGDAGDAEAFRHDAHIAGASVAPPRLRPPDGGLKSGRPQNEPCMSDTQTADAPKTIAPVTIDVVSDVVCPWCFIGKRRLEKALALKPNIPVEVRFHPYFLNPWVPREGMSRDEYLTTKFGSPDKYTAIAGRVAVAAAAEGLTYAVDKMRRQPNTLDCHRLILWAQTSARPPK